MQTWYTERTGRWWLTDLHVAPRRLRTSSNDKMNARAKMSNNLYELLRENFLMYGTFILRVIQFTVQKCVQLTIHIGRGRGYFKRARVYIVTSPIYATRIHSRMNRSPCRRSRVSSPSLVSISPSV